MVAPTSLVQALTAAKWLSDRHTVTLEQQTLADFINNGTYERYLREVRRRNNAKRGVLLEAIHKYLGKRVEVTGGGAGAHVVVWPRKPVQEESMVRSVALSGVRIYGISPYFLRKPTRAGFLLGYARLKEHEIKEGIKRLTCIL